jgi:stage V sporulation protein B
MSASKEDTSLTGRKDENVPHPPTSASSGSTQAGRGGLLLAVAKIYFMITGLVQQIALQAVLGLGAYGALSTAQSVASISYNPLIQAGVQGVSRNVAAASGEEARLIQGRLMKLHAYGAVFFALIFFFMAEPLARSLGAPHVTAALRLFSVIMLLYGLYAPMIGAINGRRRFVSQAGLDILSATLRTIGLVAGAYFAVHSLGGQARDSGLEVYGTVLGFCAAAALWVLIAVRIAGLGKPGGIHPQTRAYLKVIVPILGGQILLNLLFQADALLLRRFASDAALATGELAGTADRYVGAYRAAQLFCFLPFQLLTSLTFVLFPLLARARADNDPAQVASLIERGLRLAVLVTGCIVTTLVTVPEGLLYVVFGSEASELGGDAMRILAAGMGCFALIGVMTAAMNSIGAERASFVLTLLAVALVTTLCFVLTRGDTLSPLLLSHVALATSAAMTLTTFAAAWVLHRVAGSSLGGFTLARVLVCVSVVAWSTSHLFLVEPGATKLTAAFSTLVGAGSSTLAYLVLLALSGELGRRDWDELRSVFSSTKRP